MKLDKKERDIIVRSSLHAEESVPELAKRCGVQQHTLRSFFERLNSQEAIRKVWAIDIFRLGWHRYELLYSVRGKGGKELIEFFHSSSRVSFLGEVGGEFDYEVVVLAKNVGEVLDLIQDANRRCNSPFVAKSLSVQRTMNLFPRKYLSPKATKAEVISLGTNSSLANVNEKDLKILEHLGKTPDIQKQELAAQVGISRVTLDDRLKRLRKEGVLRGALFNFKASTYGSQNFKVLVSTRGILPELRESFFKFAMEHPNCTNFRDGLGEWDYAFGIEVERPEDLAGFRDKLWNSYGEHLAKVQVLSRLRILKNVSYPMRS